MANEIKRLETDLRRLTAISSALAYDEPAVATPTSLAPTHRTYRRNNVTLAQVVKKTRKLSAAARKKIGDAQRKRWAIRKGQEAPVAA